MLYYSYFSFGGTCIVVPGRIGPRVPLNPCDFIPNVRRKHELVVKDKCQ